MNPAYLREALELAKQGRGQTSPNPMVGAVLVRDDHVIGRGFHTYGAVKHAEMLALEQAGDQARGSTLYISLEPCSHHGRTAPCAEAIAAAGVVEVAAAMPDPNPQVSGQGFRILRDAGVAVHLASEFTAQAEKLNEPFAWFMGNARPLVTLKSALTLDGKIAAPDDNQGWITSQIARQHVQQLRHDTDSILTGIGTLLADDCLLNDRTGLPRSRPLLRVVLDSLLHIPLHSKMLESSRDDLVVVTTSAAPAARREAIEARGVKILTFDGRGGRTDLPSVVEWLAGQKYLSLMIEAGSRVNWAALDAGIVDKVFFYYGAKILGGTQALPMAGGLGRRRRADAIEVRGVTLHHIAIDEFAVEAYVHGNR